MATKIVCDRCAVSIDPSRKNNIEIFQNLEIKIGEIVCVTADLCRNCVEEIKNLVSDDIIAHPVKGAD